MSLKTDLTNLVAILLPEKRTRIIRSGSQQTNAIAHTLDVDSIHGILRSAESGETKRLFELYRDIISGHAHTQGEFGKRKLAVVGEPLVIVPQDQEDEVSVAHCKAVQDHLSGLPNWIDFLAHNLDSTLYPVSVTERSYRQSFRNGWRYEIESLEVVPHIFLKWDDGTLSIQNTDDDGRWLGTYYPPELRTHIIHRGHLLTSVPDWWGGPMRALVFWWLFATMDRDWWARFLDRYGAPFLVGRYPEEDEGARWSLQDAFSSASKLLGLVISNETEVEMHKADASNSGDAFEAFHNVANREISKLIIGQTSSSDIQKSNLGDSQGRAQAEVRDDIRKFDAVMLGLMVRNQILAPLWRINGWTTPLATVSFGAVPIEEAAISGEMLAALYQAGLEPTDDGVSQISKRTGIGLQRIQQSVTMPPLSLSTGQADLPSVAIRAARQQQARRAIASLAENASPRLARIMRSQFAEIAAAIESSDSPQDAASAVATIVGSYDPSSAGDLLQAIMAASSGNAVLASED